MALQKPGLIFTKIVLIALRSNLFHIVLSAIVAAVVAPAALAQTQPDNRTTPTATVVQDTVKVRTATAQDSTASKKAPLTDIVKRSAKGYSRINQKSKTIELYDQAELLYQDINITSGRIVVNYDKNEVYAGRIKDSAGNYTQYPVFKQGGNTVEPDSIRFNYKTQKALIWNSRTQQMDFRIKAEVTKRENDSTIYMKGARFTTSENIDAPEYYFYTSKVKFVPKSKIVVGPTHMVIADVPTPIFLPFAFFPMTDKNTSGLLLPTWGDSNNRGFYLQNLGYYFAISDYVDLAVLGDYYTNGSYGLRAESRYMKRYKFNGNFNLRYENLINSEKGFPDYSRQSIYNIQWTHNQDAKAAANSRFSASVNLGSSQYFQQSINQINIGSTLNNSMNSSVSYSRNFETVPSVNMQVTATHSQNTNTQSIYMTLPTVQVNVDRIYPFAPKEGSKKGLIKNLNFQYSVRGENRIQTTDSLFFKKEMWDNAKSGFQHSIPVTTNFKLFRYFSASLNANYSEVWQFQSIRRAYNPISSRDTTWNVNGFESYRTLTAGANVGTTLYGTFNFKENGKIQAIRHVMRPSVGYSYSPSYEKYYDTYATNASGQMDLRTYSRFENGLYGTPSKYNANMLSFSLNNTLEAKMRPLDSTSTEARKVMLLNNFNFSTSYNMAADSLRWAPVRVSGGTAFFKDKMLVNFGATLNPYAIDNAGRTINKFNIDNGGSLFRLTSANMTLNYSLNNTMFAAKTNENNTEQGRQNGGREDDLFGRSLDNSDPRYANRDAEKNKNHVSEFYNLDIPWDMTLAYSLTYGNNAREKKIINNSLMVSANADLTPRWSVGVSTGYDFANDGFSFTQLRFARDLLSWKMDFSWVPFGYNSYWSFFIGIKSSVLSDLKFDKRSVPDRRIQAR